MRKNTEPSFAMVTYQRDILTEYRLKLKKETVLILKEFYPFNPVVTIPCIKYF